jgi:hypothetical protein
MWMWVDNSTICRYNVYSQKQLAGCSSAWIERRFWEAKVADSNSVTPTYKNHFIEMDETTEKFTVEEFQENFDILIERVENGETFIITSEYGEAAIVPYDEVVPVFGDSNFDDEIVRIHTEHEEGS